MKRSNQVEPVDKFLSVTRKQMDQVVKPVFDRFKEYCEKRGEKVESYILSGSERPYPAAGFRILDTDGGNAQEIHIGLSLLRNCIEVEKGMTQSGRSERALQDVIPHPSGLTQKYVERQMNRLVEDYFNTHGT